MSLKFVPAGNACETAIGFVAGRHTARAGCLVKGYGSTIMVLGAIQHVIGSTAACVLRPKRERPGTLLRTLCVVAFDFMARADGKRLEPDKRRALSCLLDLGALINDHFDQHRFCRCSYRTLRKQLCVDETVRTAYRVYFRELRQAERNRPRLRLARHDDILRESAEYRERVVRISLSALAAVAFGRPYGDTAEARQTSPAIDACLPHVFALVMLIQICDDLIDWRRDWRAGLPTFVTAALLRCEKQAEGGADFRRVRANVQTAAATYLAATSKRKCTFGPFVPCTYAAFVLVKVLSRLALRGRTKREAADNVGLGVLQVSRRC
jgi:hypothetical protein